MSDFLPGFKPVNPAPAGRQGSMRDAARPWNALGEVGQSIAATGDMGARIAIQQKEMELKRKGAEMEMEYEQLHSQFEQDMLQNPNSTNDEVDRNWSSVAGQFVEKWNHPDMGQVELDSIGLRARALAQRGGNSMMQTSMISNIRRTVSHADNMVLDGVKKLDFERVQNGLDMQEGVIDSATLEAKREKAQTELFKGTAWQDIREDPLGSKAALDVGEAKWLKDRPWAASQDYYNLVAGQKSEENNYLADRTTELYQRMATDIITKPDDVNKLDDPVWIEKTFYSLIGQVASWNPKSGADYRKTQLLANASALLGKTSPQFKEVERVLNEKVDSIVGGKKDLAQVQLDTYLSQVERDHGWKYKKQQTPKSAIETGFLSKDNLIKLGADEETAEAISKLYFPYKDGDESKYSTPTKRATAIKKQVELFRNQYPRFRKNQKNASEWQVKMAEAVFQGSSGSIEVIDNDKKAVYDEAIGKTIMSFGEFRRKFPEKAMTKEGFNSWQSDTQSNTFRSLSQNYSW